MKAENNLPSTENIQWVPTTLEKDLTEQIEIFQHVSELERSRMERLDALLQTNTYFHETQKFEDRLDSQTVTQAIG